MCGAVHIDWKSQITAPYGRERGREQLILMYDNDNGGESLKNLRALRDGVKKEKKLMEFSVKGQNQLVFYPYETPFTPLGIPNPIVQRVSGGVG